jgi:hypothetical protein
MVFCVDFHSAGSKRSIETEVSYFISPVGEAIASKPTLNTNCGEPGNGTPTVAKT